MSAPPRFDLDALTLDAVRAGALTDVPATVLGLARTGVGLARFLADAGARVTVYDGKPVEALADAVAAAAPAPRKSRRDRVSFVESVISFSGWIPQSRRRAPGPSALRKYCARRAAEGNSRR